MIRSPIQRRYRVNKVRKIARRAGRLDAAGALGDPTIAALRQAQAEAYLAGCAPVDVELATVGGIDQGRGVVVERHVEPEDDRHG